MAEFLTMAEAEDKFGKKGRTNAERYADNCCCKTEKAIMAVDAGLQRPQD